MQALMPDVGYPNRSLGRFCVVFYNCLQICVLFYKKFSLTADNFANFLVRDRRKSLSLEHHMQ